MAITKINLSNNPVEGTPIDTCACADVATAEAYKECSDTAEHTEQVFSELEKTADVVIPEETVDEKVKVKNMYTNLVLDESINDFELVDAKALSDNDEKYDYLDYDMFDFIYGLVTDTYPKPKNPLDHRIRKFRYTGSDDYLDTNTNTGVSQVAVEDDAIVVYADNESDFDDIKTICELYKFKYSGPDAKRSSTSRWNFSFKIYVPMASKDYPMSVEDYFASIGLTIADVMPADYVAAREHAINADKTAAIKLVNDDEVNKIYDASVRKAANSNDPLEQFIEDMFAELSRRGLTFNKSRLKKAFLDEFQDDFED